MASIDCAPEGNPITDIAPGESITCSGTYAITQADIDAGQRDNTATASGTTPAGGAVEDMDSHTEPIQQAPAIMIDKEITGEDTYDETGDVISYSYTITNTGNVTLAGPFTVEDDIIGTLADCASGPLAPGNSVVCTATYTITLDDLVDGSVTNVAYATTSYNGQTVTSNNDSETATAELVAVCPGDEQLDPCMEQSDVDDAFDDWLDGFITYGECSQAIYYEVNGRTVFSLANVDAPSFCGGSVTITLYASSNCGESESCTATFTVAADGTAPVVTPAQDRMVECDGNGNTAALNAWLASHGGATASDNCGSVIWSDNYSGLSDLCGATGSATVTFTATDRCGNPTSTTATFTIKDNTPPSGACPAGVTGLTDPSQAPAPNIQLIESLYSDVCGNVSATVSTETEVISDCQDFEVRHTYTITDECGNPTTCIVTHEGRIPTEITGTCPNMDQAGFQCQDDVPDPDPAYIASFFTGGDGQAVEAILSDVNYSETSTCAWTVTREYTLFDNCGNVRVCTVNYSGEDTTPPQGACPSGYEVPTLADVPVPDADWIASHYTDNCSQVIVRILNVTETGNACDGYTATHNYAVNDNCGKNNTTLCSVSYTVPPSSTTVNGTCPPPVTGLQCWADVPDPATARTEMENAFPGAVVTYIGTTTVNNYCTFRIRHAYSINDPCLGRIICVLDYEGQDLTPPSGDCPSGESGLACQADVPAPDPAAVAASYSDNCSSVHAYLMATIVDGDDCGDFSVTYQYNVYDDCDNFITCEVVHTGIGAGLRPQGSGTVPADGATASEELEFRAYPNPTTGELFLEFENNKGEQAELVVHNVYGQKLFTRSLILDSPKYRLDLRDEGLSSGAYLVSIRTDTQVVTKTVILSKL